MGIEIFKKHLREKRAIKISAGSENFNLDSVAKICRAAQNAKASAVQIAIDKNIYESARRNTKLPLFVSSIHPFEIAKAVKFGIDAVQIGPYFNEYKSGKRYTSEEIYDIVLETMGLINDYDVYTCVTIPASLTFDEQCKLLKKLAILGVDLIQTEGYKISATKTNVMLESPEISTKNMTDILQYTLSPIMVFGVSDTNSLVSAFNDGASAVNVDLSSKNMSSEIEIKTYILKMVGGISNRNSLYKEIIKTSREMLVNAI